MKKPAYKHSNIKVEGQEAIILRRSQFETFMQQFANLTREVLNLRDRIEKLEKIIKSKK